VRKTLALGALGVVLLAGHLEAQEGLRDRDRTFSAAQKISADLRRARFRSGPFYFLSSIELADIGYDQQFFVPTAEQGSGISFGLAAPQQLYFVPNRKTVLSLQATPEYTFFTGGGRHDQFGYLLRGDAQFLFNHLYLDVFAGRSNRLAAFTGEIDRIVTARQDTTGVAGEVKYSSRTSLSFQASYRGLTFPDSRYQPEDRAIALLDRTEQAYRASLIHKTLPLTSLHLAAERSNYVFSRDPLRDAHRSYVAAGFVFDSGRSAFRAEAGPGSLKFRNPSQKSYSGVLGTAQYRKTGPLWSFTTNVNRDVDFSILAPNQYYVLDRAGAMFEYAATRRLTLRFGSNGGIDRYDLPEVTTLGLKRRRDSMSFTSVGWMYTLRRLRGGFDIGYYKRTSNIEGESQDGIRGVLHLSFTP